ncbi:MAG: hypothetical protein ABIK28_06660 [Planctomycetota bacterium]
MYAQRIVFYALVLAALCCGCTGLPFKGNDGLDSSASASHKQLYSLKEGLDLEVSFENRKTYDASQLGLFMLSQTEKRPSVVSVEDDDFFPKYFSIINVNIGDGLLFISEEEATGFAQAAYLQYQSAVTSESDLKKYKKTHVLTEMTPPKKLVGLSD